MKKCFIIIIWLLSANFIFGIDDILINSRREGITRNQDLGSLIVLKKPANVVALDDKTSAYLVADLRKKFVYKASRLAESLIKEVNIKHANISFDQSLLILLESIPLGNSKFLNRIICLDLVNYEIINAFEFQSEDRELFDIDFLDDYSVVIKSFNHKSKKFQLEFFYLKEQNFKNPEFFFELPENVSDLKVLNGKVLVKLLNKELLVFDSMSLAQRQICRSEGGVLVFDFDNDRLVNITTKGSEIFVNNNSKYLSSNFFDFPIEHLKFAIALDDSVNTILLGNDNNIYKLLELKNLVRTDMQTSKNVILLNKNLDALLTLSPKKEMLKLNHPEEVELVNFNMLRPKSQTLVNYVFFVGKNQENILVLGDSGELFKLSRPRKRYEKSLVKEF